MRALLILIIFFYFALNVKISSPVENIKKFNQSYCKDLCK